MTVPLPSGIPSARAAYTRTGPLTRVNPLAKIAGPLPAILVVLFTPGLVIGAVLLGLGLAVILGLGRLRAKTAAFIVTGLAAMVLVITIGLGLFAGDHEVQPTTVLARVGPVTVYTQNVIVGLGTALRMGALLTLVLIGGMTTTAEDLVKSMIRYLRLPYRIGYAALAAYRFVPRFRRELDLVRAAHTVRGPVPGSGPTAGIRRRLGYGIPLLAGAIRHAERVALAMDSRAFGYLPYRTERSQPTWRTSDTVFVLTGWVTIAIVLVLGW